jgi:hypothetical protein
MAGERHVEPPGIEREVIRLGETRERMQGDDDGTLQTLPAADPEQREFLP